jgi:hypothetical protein
VLSIYPDSVSERDQWILSQRPARNTLNPREPYLYFVEEERSANGMTVPVATVFLTNRECPWRCVMCDLWRNSLEEGVSIGDIPEQIRFTLHRLQPARVIKLYNSGSFFDTRAIPLEDYPAIAKLTQNFERVIVESHPLLVGDRCMLFRNMIRGRLEVAMGLETAHPGVLEKLNKRMTLEQFARAADFLRRNNIDLRVFILVQPPFMKLEDHLEWAQRSLDFAFDCGACVITLMPTRMRNGAMEALAANGDGATPKLSVLEHALSYGLSLKRGRVFTDLWDMRKDAECKFCFDKRVERLHTLNLSQKDVPAVACKHCEGRR